MKKYQITCQGNVLFERTTPEEIMKIWAQTIKALQDLEREAPDRVKGYTLVGRTRIEYVDGETLIYTLKL